MYANTHVHTRTPMHIHVGRHTHICKCTRVHTQCQPSTTHTIMQSQLLPTFHLWKGRGQRGPLGLAAPLYEHDLGKCPLSEAVLMALLLCPTWAETQLLPCKAATAVWQPPPAGLRAATAQRTLRDVL